MKTLKQVREDKGVTKKAVARYIGVTEKTYSSYEDNPSSMRIKQAQKIAEFLSTDVNEIFFVSTSN